MRIPTLHALAVVIALSSPVAMSAAPNVAAQKPPTADKQSQSRADLALAQQIRRAVVKDKTLSISAHNCKIITQQGLVTLRGVVNSERERTAVADIAAQFAGVGNVTNLLTIKVKK